MEHFSSNQFLAAIILGTVIGIPVFLHADKNGSRHATAWGISVFLAAGIAFPIYVVHVLRTRRSKRRW